MQFSGMTSSRPDSVLLSRPSSLLFSRPASSLLISRPPSASFLPRPPSTSTRRPINALRFRKTLSSKCSICSEDFNYKSALPCFQNFCTQCLEDHVLTFKRGTGCDCPLCKSGILLPKSRSRRKSAKYSSKLSPLACDVCEQVCPAKYRCVECDDYYCEKCNKDFLRRMRIDQNFNVTDLSDLTADESLTDFLPKDLTAKETLDDLSSFILPPGFGVPCKQHTREEYRFFCTECETPICRDCKILKHEGHPARALEDVHDERKQYLTDAVRLANKNVRKLHSECAEINSKRVDIEQETRDIEQEIMNHVNQLKKIIDDIAERMVKIVKAQNNESRGSLHKSRDTAKEKIKLLQDMINDATTLLESENRIDTVNNSLDMIQQLNDADSSGTAEKLWRKRYVFDSSDLEEAVIKKMVGKLRCLTEGLLKPLPSVDLEMQSTFNCDQNYKHTSALAPLSDSSIWVCNGYRNKIQRFDICGAILETEILSFDVDDMAVGKDGSLYLTEVNGKVIRKVSQRKPISVFARGDVYLRGVCTSYNGDTIIACGNDVPFACMREAKVSKILMFDLNGKLQKEIPLHLGTTLFRICHTVNEELVVSTGISGKYLVLSEIGKVKHTYQASSTADWVASDKHGLIYLSSCDDDTLYILDYQGSPLPSTYAMHRPNAVAIDDNDTVWVGDWSKIHVLQFKD